MDEGQKKFDTCRYRSGDKCEIGEFSCCKDNRKFGYVCWRRDIEDVRPKHCSECVKYKEKANKYLELHEDYEKQFLLAKSDFTEDLSQRLYIRHKQKYSTGYTSWQIPPGFILPHWYYLFEYSAFA